MCCIVHGDIASNIYIYSTLFITAEVIAKTTINKQQTKKTKLGYNNDKVTSYAYLQYKLSDKRYLTINF